jgi:phospholipase C
VNNATSVKVTGSDGSSYTIPATGGTQIVSPTADTTYTATATGAGGSATATAKVTVTAAVGPPTVTIAGSPTTINQGDSATLTVTATNATSVTVSGTDGSSYTMGATGGTQTVTPTTTTSYVATAAGTGGNNATATVTITVNAMGPPTLTLTASPTAIVAGGTSTLNATATNATSVTVTGTDGSSYTLQPTGGTQTVQPTDTTTYTATAKGAGGTTTAQATVTVEASGNETEIDHVIFMMQENRSFDTYFGMLDPYRDAKGWNTYDGTLYEADGLTTPDGSGSSTVLPFSNEDNEKTSFPLFKFTSTCIDDMSSAWLESYGDVNRYDFSTTRSINMDGFVHNAEGFAKSCNLSGKCSGGTNGYTDTTGERAMGYYDQGFLNYYYYMASQFALSDRWFSPVSSKTVDDRIATMTGGTTLGLTRDPGSDDHLGQVDANTIFKELDKAGVSWKIYYTVTQGNCVADDECSGGAAGNFPASEFEDFAYSVKYVYSNKSGAACTAPTQPSSVVGDSSNSFCIDPTHIAPLSDATYGYFADLKNNTLPAFAYIEPGFGQSDEHPGYQGNILIGQAQVAKIVNALMTSPAWPNTVFFLSYDEGGGPFDHVPPVPGHSNDYTNATVGAAAVSSIPDISTIAVNPDSFNPCVPTSGVASGNSTTGYCDLSPGDPGTNSGDAAAQQGFAAQLGFRVPNLVISPFTKPHYVGHNPMDHTAVIQFVENRFIGPGHSLTKRDAAQPNLLDFFDFTNPPWLTPPTPPTPVTNSDFPSSPCHADSYGQ